jgi:hypothetical protein
MLFLNMVCLTVAVSPLLVIHFASSGQILDHGVYRASGKDVSEAEAHNKTRTQTLFRCSAELGKKKELGTKFLIFIQ